MKKCDFKRNAKNLPMHELNGLKVKIVKSKDSSKTGLEGKITWETKKTFEIETKKGLKKVSKRESVFEFKFPKNKAIIDGKIIEIKPEDRIKVFAKKIKV